MGWTAATFNFVADDTGLDLTFLGLASSAWGPAIDDVSVAAVPLPSAAFLWLSGFGAVPTLRRRKS